MQIPVQQLCPIDSMTDPFPSEFDNRRAELVGVIGDSLEKVLQQINTLNRNLESMIAIGNEFSAVEALWSQFENVMDGAAQTGVGVDDGGTVSGPEHDHGLKQEQEQEQEQEQAEMTSAVGGGGGGGEGSGGGHAA